MPRLLLVTAFAAISLRADIVTEALRWFPANTETVLVNREAFWLKELANAPNGNYLAAFVDDMLSVPEDLKLRKHWADKRVDFMILGARSLDERATAPGAGIPLGLSFYRGCMVLGFHTPLQMPSPLAVKVPYPGRSRKEPDRKRQLFFSQLRPRLLLVCNDEAFYEETLEGIAKPKAISAFEKNPDWRRLERGLLSWGMRLKARETILIQLLKQGRRIRALRLDEEFSLWRYSAVRRGEKGFYALVYLLELLGFRLTV